MRLKKEMIEYIATSIAGDLLKKQLIEIDCAKEKIAGLIGGIITNDLVLEDKLNEEVKELLKTHETELDRGNIDYRKVFQMIKQKLAKEREIIL
ncbi:MAG: hypothetical protein A3I04_00810 [Nitrospinae bacterium RIFCSPLOWO2_02_FULL_39_110]|nr:MAG: hypothetical protein A3I04_00810 [Nitrospinae bacterium RIFCSPLOWO2_02_FULL_39_110]OGW08575.1 MAG: hypothetical protein A3F81_01420 [Nitrospinae bacterium RIFCSPLOWO2_12_FULL_39_93]OGW08904.1 MAG: hypothetical protein A2W75_01455 [Nitrospinae bacterium RIFCSPLOWO2_12_39_15]HLA47657.1 DUF507 family protein [Nitrospinota bacterium]